MDEREIGSVLRKSRKASGLLLRQAAAEVEMDMPLLSHIERGRRLPTVDQVRRLAGLYGCSHDSFLAARAFSEIKQKYGQAAYFQDCLQMLNEDAGAYRVK